jgi:hypothetical protein
MNTTIMSHAAAKVRSLLQLSDFSHRVAYNSSEEFLDSIKAKEPVYAPNQKSTYSNVAFNLLGLALENQGGTFIGILRKAYRGRLEASSVPRRTCLATYALFLHTTTALR